MILGPDVFREQAAIDDASVDERLEHGEHVAVHLGLVGHKRSGRVENAGIDLPAGSGLEAIRARQKEDAVVPLAPVLEAAPHLVSCRARLEPHERERKGVFDLVVLRREVVRLGLALLIDELRKRITLVQVMGNRSHVVEELAEQVPSTFVLHGRRPEQEIAALVDERLEQHAGAVFRPHVAQSFVVRCPGTVRGVRRRGEPALVDAAAVCPEGVQIVGMQPEPPAGDHERARDPARLET